jgi:hypothetical protein
VHDIPKEKLILSSAPIMPSSTWNSFTSHQAQEHP